MTQKNDPWEVALRVLLPVAMLCTTLSGAVLGLVGYRHAVSGWEGAALVDFPTMLGGEGWVVAAVCAAMSAGYTLWHASRIYAALPGSKWRATTANRRARSS